MTSISNLSRLREVMNSPIYRIILATAIGTAVSLNIEPIREFFANIGYYLNVLFASFIIMLQEVNLHYLNFIK